MGSVLTRDSAREAVFRVIFSHDLLQRLRFLKLLDARDGHTGRRCVVLKSRVKGWKIIDQKEK